MQLTLKDLGIVSLKNGQLTYLNENTFAIQPYTSMAGNTYLSVVSFLPNLVIKQEIGHGRFYTFLNGLRLYTRKDSILIAEQNYHNQIYCPDFVKKETCELFMNAVRNMARRQKIEIDESSIRQHFINEVGKYLISKSNLHLLS